MAVDSFRFLPRLIALFYRNTALEPNEGIPWTPLRRPLSACKIGLLTSAGLYHIGHQPAFDLQREREHPTWGDPTFRVIPTTIDPHEIGVSHLHYNPAAVLQDINVLLPIHRMQEMVIAGTIGALAHHHYAFMGYQGFPPDTTAWQQIYGPQVASRLLAEGVDCVLLTPT